MSAFNKFNNFVQNLGAGKFNFAADALKVLLTNTAPLATASQYSDLSATEVAAGNGYATGGAAVGGVGWANASGTSTLTGNQVTWTASGGSIGPFRYAVLYDATTGFLVGWWDYGAALTVTAGNTFTIEPSGQATGGTILTLT